MVPGTWNSRPLRTLDGSVEPSAAGWAGSLKSVIADESVMHLDDLVMRRTTLWENPNRALVLAPQLCNLFDWDRQRTAMETDRLRESLGSGRSTLQQYETKYL
jgi:hypothetical protein